MESRRAPWPAIAHEQDGRLTFPAGFEQEGAGSVPAKARPRPYTTLDRDYLAQDTIRDLGHRFGAQGPLVFLALILHAGSAISESRDLEVGAVEEQLLPSSCAFGPLAREAFTSADAVREIIGMAVELGLIGEFEELGGDRFTARLLKADRWEKPPKSGASAPRITESASVTKQRHGDEVTPRVDEDQRARLGVNGDIPAVGEPRNGGPPRGRVGQEA